MPYVVAVYDVRPHRAARVLKLFRRYLFHVQRSVFEGTLTERQRTQLMDEARRLIDPNEDCLILYEIAHPHLVQRELIGSELYPMSTII